MIIEKSALPEETESEGDKPPSSPLVISHGRCTDGFCSAWVASKVFPRAEFHFALFNEPLPDVEGRDVYILDFSYDRDTLIKMKARAKSLVVIDHHKTAKAALVGLPYCVFDMNHSGAGLTWQYFSRIPGSGLKGPPPWVVRYVEDRDLWRHGLPYTHAINAYIASFPFDFKVWDRMAARSLHSILSEGRVIFRYQKQVAEDLLHYAREVDFDGHHVLSVNTSIMNSDVGTRLARHRPFGVVWFQREDGKYVYSLRSDGRGLDVSEIAKQHGGGGHEHCSGFVSDRLLA